MPGHWRRPQGPRSGPFGSTGERRRRFGGGLNGWRREKAATDHRQEDQEGRPWSPWRRLEDRLCRLRDRDDGFLPADVAAGLDHRWRQEGHCRLLPVAAQGVDGGRLGFGRFVASDQGRRPGTDANHRPGQARRHRGQARHGEPAGTQAGTGARRDRPPGRPQAQGREQDRRKQPARPDGLADSAGHDTRRPAHPDHRRAEPPDVCQRLGRGAAVHARIAARDRPSADPGAQPADARRPHRRRTVLGR